MSDGDSHGADATPDPRRPREPESDWDNEWLTRSSRRSAGAAPWERSEPLRRAQPEPEADVDAPDGTDETDESGEPSGSHTAGAVTVADLIAKLNGDGAAPAEITPKRRRAEPDPEPEPEPPAPETEVIEAIREPVREAADPDRQDTEIIPAATGAYADNLPVLAADPRDRVPPYRIGDGGAGGAEDEPHRRRRIILAGRSAAALLAVLALVLTGGAWQWQSSKNSLMNRVSALDQDSRDIVDPNAQFGDENFLIVGVDSRIGDNSGMGAGTTDDAAGARSDTVMLVNIPANRKRVVAVSFPRDLSIDPMECEPWNPETGAYGPIEDPESPMYGQETVYTEYKLNSAYAVGGPKCLVKVVQKLSGLSVNRFMAVDFAGFSKMVDALGGVEVCSTEPLEDYELGTVLPVAGRQMVDGHTALNYVRARQVTTEINGDYGRIKRQQRFLSSLLRSLISKEVFFSLSKLNNVVNMFIDDSYVDNIDTRDLVTLGQSIQGVTAGRISFVTVPTTGYADEYGNETPRTDDMRALFTAIINDDPLPGEKNADNTPVPGTPESTTADPEAETAGSDSQPNAELVNAVATEPQDVTVQVSNSTGQTGLGATTAEALQQYGFNVTTPDDYPSAMTATTVFFSPGNEQAAATVASSFANPTIERVGGMGDIVQVVLGSDFDTVAAPTPSGSPVQVNVLHDTGSTPAPLPEDLNVTNAADTSCE
ncbi:transcriptional regulator [Mycobacterium sp. IS-1742]|uniref:LCP family protein n=1 Tax=Mycobacterium sp. IS-1742 TaxID=1772285 RepID=UPI00073FD6AE|nr:LCP family protein [Mycobacterium sp. IS-1742]KUI32881.1 transcriptional regulator [Mycobacterium sp. IS-1742]